MESKSKCLIVFIFIVAIAGSIITLRILTDDDDRNSYDEDDSDDENVSIDYPDTLSANESPVLILPIKETENLNKIQPFGKVGDYDHNGIDFNVIKETIILCPHNAYVEDVRFYYNDAGGHWQTNIRLELNDHWWISMKFESWASTEEEGKEQWKMANFSVGTMIQKGEEMGTLLSHGEYSHLHFDLDNDGTYLCPYNYFSDEAKTKFDELYEQIGTSEQPCN